jgi:hypothetical protein
MGFELEEILKNQEVGSLEGAFSLDHVLSNITEQLPVERQAPGVVIGDYEALKKLILEPIYRREEGFKTDLISFDTSTSEEVIPMDSVANVEREETSDGASFSVQVAAHKVGTILRSHEEYLKELGYPVYSVAVDVPGKGNLSRLLVGPFQWVNDARLALADLKDLGLSRDAFIVVDNNGIKTDQ